VGGIKGNKKAASGMLRLTGKGSRLAWLTGPSLALIGICLLFSKWIKENPWLEIITFILYQKCFPFTIIKACAYPFCLLDGIEKTACANGGRFFQRENF
jgi:hypothetical protein